MKAFARRLVVAAAFAILPDHFPAAPPPERVGADIVEDEPGWVPFSFTRDIVPGSALDFSGFLDAPAGKRGWLRAVGEHFEFEGSPGVPVRFNGVNVCMNLNILEHAAADRLANRLAALGYNSVRFHHHDGRICGWSGDGDPPEGWKGDGSLDLVAMEKFDYLFAKCAEKGLYATTDLYVSRRVPWREMGIDRDGFPENDEFKALTLLHEGAFENWKRFSREFLLHLNPYTGRRYIDDPAMPLLCTVNEGWLVGGWFKVRDLPETAALYEEWKAEMAARHGPGFMRGSLAPSAAEANCWQDNSAATWLFMAWAQQRGHRRQAEFLKSLGVKALLTAGNHGPNNAPNQDFRIRLLDYVDTHWYVDHPDFPQGGWGLPSVCRNAVSVASIERLAPNVVSFARAAGKPFTVTEWNFCAPGEGRSIAGLYTGALAAAQDWAGVWRFDYGHAAASANTAPGPFSVPDYFVLANDPVAQAADRAVAHLFLRGDMPTLAPRLNLVIDEAALVRDGPAPGDAAVCQVRPELASVVWKALVSTSLSPLDGAENFPVSVWGKRVGCETNAIPTAAPDNPHVRFSAEEGWFRIETGRTCGVFASAGRHCAGPLAAEISGGKAVTVVATSLDGEPLPRSRRILLSHLTDCRGRGAQSGWDGSGRYRTESWGKGGILVRDATTRISLALEGGAASPKVYALGFDGSRRFEIPASFDNISGRLSFDASVRGDDGNAVLEYEIALL